MNTDPGLNSVDPGLLAIPKTHRLERATYWTQPTNRPL